MKRLMAFLVAAMLIASGTRAQTTIVADVRAAIARKDMKAADALLAAFRQANGTTPEALEAMSWLGRGALAAEDNDGAVRYSQETRKLVVAMLPTHPLAADPHLQTALGAAIETEGKAMAAVGLRAGAILFLRQQRDGYRNSPISGRIQKNINLLSLEGQPAPPLHAQEYLGAPMPRTQGHPVILFFWAHWCPDCKAMASTLAELQAQYRDTGFTIVAPTQRYGYVAKRAAAAPAVEMPYIGQVLKEFYGNVQMTVPVSAESFANYGSSTTPTIVIVDREGIVRLYHPGQMSKAELEPQIQAVVKRSTAARR
jgi:thiol-disulfide isomerase/thioredoxin